ncbi:MAG: hypothetical protein GY801_11195 [bacterium]|nr:hypothetical protein [bacterium]
MLLHFSVYTFPWLWFLTGTHCGISRCHWIAIEIGIVIGCHFISFHFDYDCDPNFDGASQKSVNYFRGTMKDADFS